MNLRKSAFIKHQRGDLLVESMIGMLLMVIIGMGMMHVSSRAAVAQHDMRLQEIAVNQMRSMLIRNKMGAVDLCATPPDVTLPDGTALTPDVQGCDSTTTASIEGVDIEVPKPIALSVTLPAREEGQEPFQVVVGGTWDAI